MGRIFRSMKFAAGKQTRINYLTQPLSAGILNGIEFQKMTVSVFYFVESLKLIG
jgi:hypothetical protein